MILIENLLMMNHTVGFASVAAYVLDLISYLFPLTSMLKLL